MSLEQLMRSLKMQTGAQASDNGVEGRGLPPVERWNPTYCGEAGFEILTDGTWKHEGVRITRAPMVRLFSTILRKDEDGVTYLVTPVEKIRVDVEDAPFLAVRADRHVEDGKQVIVFTTNVGDVFAAGPENPIIMRTGEDGSPRPYVRVRGRLEARILRAPFFELVEWARLDGEKLVLDSGGAAFDLGSMM